MSDNKTLLVKLQAGATEQLQNGAVQTITQVNGPGTCTTKPTDAVTIDSNSFGSDDCADISFTFANTTNETQVLRFGKPGQAGVYQKLNLSVDASNVAGVTADAGDGPQANVLPLQGFNFLTQDGIVVTGFEVEIISGGNTQANQKVTLVRQSVNVTDKCKTTRVRPDCSLCINQNDPQVYLFKFCRMWDAYNHADYPLLAGASVNIKVYYAGLATAKGVVACAGQYAGQVVTSVNVTA